MKILIYSPSNLRASDQQAQAELLISQGHQVFLLTWLPIGILHEKFLSLGARATSSSHVKGRSLFFFLNQARYLVKYCKTNKIDIVFSHLQSNAVVAGIAKPFVKARFFYFRHNADYFSLVKSKKSRVLNKLANLLSPVIIAISDNVKSELIREGVPEKRIKRINLCYNFSDYGAERMHNSSIIRNEISADLLLISVARLDKFKRHIMAFEVVRQLVTNGLDCKLICIGEGPYRPELERWLKKHNMQNEIVLKGHVSNVFDFLDAADLMLLLSCSEASNNAVKEAGICCTPVIVCREVGDFEAYIIHNENSYLVNKINPINEAVEILQELQKNKKILPIVGDKLNLAVASNFNIENVKIQYNKILGL